MHSNSLSSTLDTFNSGNSQVVKVFFILRIGFNVIFNCSVTTPSNDGRVNYR